LAVVEPLRQHNQVNKANRKDLASLLKRGALVAVAAAKDLFLEPANNLWSRFYQP
jgi:hypothetical protein